MRICDTFSKTFFSACLDADTAWDEWLAASWSIAVTLRPATCTASLPAEMNHGFVFGFFTEGFGELVGKEATLAVATVGTLRCTFVAVMAGGPGLGGRVHVCFGVVEVLISAGLLALLDRFEARDICVFDGGAGRGGPTFFFGGF